MSCEAALRTASRISFGTDNRLEASGSGGEMVTTETENL